MEPKPHTPRPLYRELANAIQAYKNCIAKSNTEWQEKWAGTIETFTNLLPSGSGIDSGTKIDLDLSHAEKFVLYADYQHTDDTGYYDGWTEHTITVTPSFSGINLRISGPNRNDIKDHLHETFYHALTRDVTYERFLETFPGFAVTSKWEDKDGTASECYQAWYSNGVRFWNDFDGARNHAANLMEQAFYAPKVGA